ncbi:MAG TPA: archease [Acidimicrobiales bacterium]|nr:archease [Acidimicrobiales bacterium]
MAHTADCIIEGWGPDRAACAMEALSGLIEAFASVPEAPSTRVLPLAASAPSPEDQLVSLLEDVIYTVEVLSVVPIRFHLAETDDGGLAGDMEVVPLDAVTPTGPAPKAVSYHDLAVQQTGQGWRCHVLIDV